MRGLGVLIVVLAGACRFTAPGEAADAAIDAPDAAPDAPSPERKKRITIDPAKVTGDQTSFPVWIALTDNDVKALALADGSDIRFTRTDGSPLEYEIQSWNKGSGRLEAWVRVELQDSAPTLLEIRYGDPGRKRPPNPPMVFVNGFAAVWHLDDLLSGSTITDSLGARNGTPMNLTTGDQEPGQLGRGIEFDDGTKQILFSNPYSGAGPHTISAWIEEGDSTNCDSIVVVGNAATPQSRFLHAHHPQNDQGAVGFYNSEDWFDPSGMDLNQAGWVLVHWTYASGVSRMYRNGVLVDTHNHTMAIDTQGTGGYIGFAPDGWAGTGATCALQGKLDEVRLATVARSTGWIETEYANQKSPQTFYSVGPEERSP